MKFKWLFIVLLLLTDCFFLMLWFLDNKYWPIQRLQGYFARFYSTSFVELLFVFNMWFISNYLSVLVWYRKKSSLLSIKIYIWSSIISQKGICFPSQLSCYPHVDLLLDTLSIPMIHTFIPIPFINYCNIFKSSINLKIK